MSLMMPLLFPPPAVGDVDEHFSDDLVDLAKGLIDDGWGDFLWT